MREVERMKILFGLFHFSLTPRFSGVSWRNEDGNRFNGFHIASISYTPLKPGVNEIPLKSFYGESN